jgi:hypothetical protein
METEDFRRRLLADLNNTDLRKRYLACRTKVTDVGRRQRSDGLFHGCWGGVDAGLFARDGVCVNSCDLHRRSGTSAWPDPASLGLIIAGFGIAAPGGPEGDLAEELGPLPKVDPGGKAEETPRR